MPSTTDGTADSLEGTRMTTKQFKGSKLSSRGTIVLMPPAAVAW